MSKLERLMNLTAALLETSRPLSAEELRRRVPGYPDAKASFRRAFERDKEDLREMGVPIRVQPIESDEQRVEGYRILKDEYYLPDPGLSADELAALHLAASAITIDGATGSEALWKLGGKVGDDAGAPLAELAVDPHLATLFEAIRERRRVAFTYRDVEREVDPARLGYERGRWYLTAHDHTRDGTRMFRLDRIESEVSLGEVDSATRQVTDHRSTARPWELGTAAPVFVDLAIDADHVAFAARQLGDHVDSRPGDDGAMVFRVPVVAPEAFRSFVLGFLDHAEVLSPPYFRDDLIAWLRSAMTPT